MANRFLQLALRLSSGLERRLADRLIRGGGYSYTADWVTAQTALWTSYLQPWQGIANVQMLEIGSFEGRSAIWFLENVLTAPTATLTCIDLFHNRTREIAFQHNIQVAGFTDKVIKIKGRSQDILKVLRQNHYDLIYIDGGHHAIDAYTDALLSWPLLIAGGLIIFDDYLWFPQKPAEERPQPGIDRFLQETEQELALLHKAYQVIVQKRDGAVER